MQNFRRFAFAASAWISFAGIAHADPGVSLSAPAGSSPGAQSPVVSVNWGQAHGITPAQDGFNNLETTISASNAVSLQLKWRKISTVKNLSTPVVVNGRVFVTGQDAALNYNLYAFDATTGAPIAHFPRVNVSGISPSVALSPPVASGNIVYVSTRNGSSSQLFAYNATTGGKIAGFPVDLGGSGIAPATVGVIPVNGTPTPAVFEPAGDSHVYGFDAKTGVALPNYPISAAGQFISAAASLVNVTINGAPVSDLCVASYDDYVYCFDAATGNQLFNVKTSGFFDVGGPAVSNGVLYFISWGEHQLHAVDVTTGVSKWPATLTLPFASDSTPAIANGQVVVGDYGGNLYSVNAATGTVKWKVKLDNSIVGSAVIANGVIYVNTSALINPSGTQHLFAIDAATGAKLWRFSNAGTYGLTPVVVNGTVYAVSTTRGLSAFALP